MEASPTPPGAARRVVLAASIIAASFARGQLPAAKDLFVLSAAVVHAAKAADHPALRLSVDSVAALLEELPEGVAYDNCRGHLRAVSQFAWLLLRASGAAGMPPDDQDHIGARLTPTA